MGDLKFFRIDAGSVVEMPGGAVALERSLQRLIEANMPSLFGVTFLASEFGTGAKHGGRVDSLGIDENGSPVIFEYKRALNENVINQGLFYLDWLVDHRGDFTVLVQRQAPQFAISDIDWSAPRLVCVAADFTRYDEHAVIQMGRNIDLVRYRYFDDLLVLDMVATVGAKPDAAAAANGPGVDPAPKRKATQPTNTERRDQASEALRGMLDDLEAWIAALGDDVTATERAQYTAYRRIKNFACVEIHHRSGNLLVYVKADLDAIALQDGFTRDMTNVGHWGTGNLEIKIVDRAALEKAKPLIQASYEAN